MDASIITLHTQKAKPIPQRSRRAVPTRPGREPEQTACTDAVAAVLRRATAAITSDSIHAVLTLEHQTRINDGLVAGILAGQIDATLPPDFHTDKVATVEDFAFQARDST